MKRFIKVKAVYTEDDEFITRNDETVEICFTNVGVEVKYCPEINPSYGSRQIERYFFPVNKINKIQYMDKSYL